MHILSYEAIIGASYDKLQRCDWPVDFAEAPRTRITRVLELPQTAKCTGLTFPARNFQTGSMSAENASNRCERESSCKHA